ncbi:MAG: carboxypeptidase-like regulatory domain-containing protein [Bacteroidales bacterium]|jgi:hypothetical protein
MKSRQYIIIVCLFFLSLILKNCKKDEFLPDLKGSLVGYVYTFDEFSHVLSDHSGVLIIAIGKYKIYRTFSDKNGRFEFENLPAGTYELNFAKPGFGTLRQFNIQHLGGEPTVLNMVFDHSINGSAFFLYQLPATEITYLNIVNDTIYCRCSLTAMEHEFIYIQLFISLQENFDTQTAELILTNLGLVKKGDLFYGQLYYLTPLERHPGLPFKPGEEIYFKACASPFYGSGITLFNHWYLFGIDSYFDYENNRIVYPALGKESAQYSYTMPE